MSFGPPLAGLGPVAPPVWTPPTEIEQASLEAKAREEWTAYFDTLVDSRLYFEIRRDGADAEPSRTIPVFGEDPRVAGGRVWAVYTEGMLPVPDPHRVLDWQKLGWFAKVGRRPIRR
ncbi:hypothetical protein ACN6LA_000070 [Streptomyces sp. SAS_269]|uniref:hypothetical protein n=1 Tax=Streptomyces sp. SAS_269 TaxID=3412749 RepID=UPI00403C8771